MLKTVNDSIIECTNRISLALKAKGIPTEFYISLTCWYGQQPRWQFALTASDYPTLEIMLHLEFPSIESLEAAVIAEINQIQTSLAHG